MNKTAILALLLLARGAHADIVSSDANGQISVQTVRADNLCINNSGAGSCGTIKAGLGVSGRVGIGTLTPQTLLDVNGTITALAVSAASMVLNALTVTGNFTQTAGTFDITPTGATGLVVRNLDGSVYEIGSPTTGGGATGQGLRISLGNLLLASNAANTRVDLAPSQTVVASATVNGFAVYTSTFLAPTSGIVTMGSQAGVGVKLTADTTFPSGSFNAIFWTSTDFMTQNMWVATSSDTFTVPAGGTGLYYTNCQVETSAGVASTIAVKITRSGTTMAYAQNEATASGKKNISVSKLLSLAAGDAIKCQWFSNAVTPVLEGSTSAGSNFFEITKVR